MLDAKDFWFAIQNRVFIVISILSSPLSSVLLIAVLVNRSFPGRGIVRVLLISPFFVMPAVNAVLWINMILDPVLGLNGLAVGGINDLVVGLREFPVIGPFFFMWPELQAHLLPCQPDVCLCCDHDGRMAVDALCGSDFHDLLAV